MEHRSITFKTPFFHLALISFHCWIHTFNIHTRVISELINRTLKTAAWFRLVYRRFPLTNQWSGTFSRHLSVSFWLPRSLDGGDTENSTCYQSHQGHKGTNVHIWWYHYTDTEKYSLVHPMFNGTKGYFSMMWYHQGDMISPLVCM